MFYILKFFKGTEGANFQVFRKRPKNQKMENNVGYYRKQNRCDNFDQEAFSSTNSSLNQITVMDAHSIGDQHHPTEHTHSVLTQGHPEIIQKTDVCLVNGCSSHGYDGDAEASFLSSVRKVTKAPPPPQGRKPVTH